MGNGTSVHDLPERLTLSETMQLFRHAEANHRVNTLMFMVMQDDKQTISRLQALQLLENKLPFLPSVNPLS